MLRAAGLRDERAPWVSVSDEARCRQSLFHGVVLSMGITRFDPTRYTVDYIPQRLRALEVCVLACHAVLSDAVGATALDLDLGSSRLQQPDLSLMVGIAIDAGMVANRTLLNFMGLKLDNGQVVSESYALTIEKFSLPLVQMHSACQILAPGVPPDEMKRIWAEALTAASKSIAHLTEAGGTIRVARLGYACYATAKLLRKEFFQATGAAEPESLIPFAVEPRFGGVWDAVDPRLNVIQ